MSDPVVWSAQRLAMRNQVRACRSTLADVMRTLGLVDLGVQRELTSIEWAELRGKMQGVAASLREQADTAHELSRVRMWHEQDARTEAATRPTVQSLVDALVESVDRAKAAARAQTSCECGEFARCPDGFRTEAGCSFARARQEQERDA